MEPEPTVVRAVWNPATGELPSPTNLARNAQTQRLEVPLEDAATPADREFTRYLNSLDGFALSSTLEIPLSDDIFEPALRGAFFAFDVNSGQSLDLELAFDPDTDLVTATPTAAPADPSDDPADNRLTEFLPGRTYAFGLRGYDGGLIGANGHPVIADAGFYLVRSISALDEHPAAMPGETRAEKIETAEKLRDVQLDYGPLIELATQSRGFPRGELAVLSAFTTTAKPAIWFDPNTGRIPMPNQLLIDPVTGKVDLPVADDDADEVREVKLALSEYDGFSASGAIVLEATHPVDPATVNDPAAIRLFQKGDDGSLTEITDLERGVLDDGKTFWIQPRLTLAPNADYVLVATQHLTGQSGTGTGGERVRAQPLGALLRSKATLFEGGASQVSAVDDATAEMLEPVRQKTERVLDQLEQSGQFDGSQFEGGMLTRDLVSAAVPFRTVSAVERLMDQRAKLYEQDVRTDVVDVEVASPLARGLWLAMPQVKTIATGEMFVLDHLDPTTRSAYADGSAQVKKASFVLTIPSGVEEGKPMPVVLFGHGLMTSRELVYLIANKLASAGYASFSLDLPYHGNRAVCIEDSDCRGEASCDAVGQCIEPNGTPGEISTIEVPFVDAEYPISTGFAFVEVGNLIGTRDHFAQATLDLMQGLRVIRDADWIAATGGYKLSDDVVYLGMSLGGIVGANLSAAEPTIETFVLNVPGADYFELIESSGTFRGQFQTALAHRGVEQGSDAHFKFGNTVRWLLDPVDPLNLVQHTVGDPVTYVDPVDGQEKTAPRKRVLIQMAKNDSVVPNVATRILSERMGVPISEYEPAISNHGFLFDPTSFEGRDARNEMVEFFDAR
jgi:pimeloyl-ACP methyl ester carboxylesterase